MKFTKKNYLTIAAFGAILFVFAVFGVKSLAQMLEGYVVEGESLDSIQIGKSTADDVIANYGTDYKLINHRNYSYEMIYKSLGLSFYYCLRDPNKEIFVVEIEAPFRATTKSGIVLGESTVADVFQIYGTRSAASSDFDYDGILFSTEESTADEDQEDARFQPQTVENAETETEESENPGGFIIDGASGAESSFVIDGQEVTNFRNSDVSENNNVAENESDEVVENESENEIVQADEVVQESEVERAFKARIIRRIELIEKGGLRQCDSKFPRK